MQVRRYNQSELGKKTRSEWLKTDKGKTSVAKANKKYVLSGGLSKWLKTEKGQSYKAHVVSVAESERRFEVNRKVAEFIKTNRLKKGLTQTELGEQVNISQSVVHSWEIGRSIPTYETSLLLSEIFGIKYRKGLEPLIKEAKKKSKKSLENKQ